MIWLCFQGKGTADEDFIWMWSQFQNKSYSKLLEASNGSKPEVILWSSHLTNEDNIHNLVRRFKMRASQYNFHLSRTQMFTQSKFGLTLWWTSLNIGRDAVVTHKKIPKNLLQLIGIRYMMYQVVCPEPWSVPAPVWGGRGGGHLWLQERGTGMGDLCYCAGCCGVCSFAVNVGDSHILLDKRECQVSDLFVRFILLPQ